jgi:hypothetical protein
VNAKKPRYTLWVAERQLASYASLNQALLGAVWRSRKLEGETIGIYTSTKTGGQRGVAFVYGPPGFEY